MNDQDIWGDEFDWSGDDDPPPDDDNEIARRYLVQLGYGEFIDQDIVVDFSAVPKEYSTRALVFTNLLDAVNWLVSTGLIAIGSLVVRGDDGPLVAVPNETGKRD